MIEKERAEAERRMQRSVSALQAELGKLRTGRANVNLLEGIMVSYYDNETPLNQVASVSVQDARTLMISPWEKQIVPDIEKAILSSGLGLNPVTVGQVIRVPLPPLTEERRRDLSKVLKQEIENAKVAVRNIRRDANNRIKETVKDKSINEDDGRRAEEQIQRLTDKFIAEIDKVMATKEAELMEV